MTRIYENKAAQTLSAIHRLRKDGITKISVLMRHSERSFTDNPDLEPFMALTDNGRQMAFNFGQELPISFTPVLFASYIGRCIETAYLIDKGFTREHGPSLSHTKTHENFAPFYIKDIEKVISLLEKTGNDLFLKKWFDKKFDKSVIEDPVKTADQICRIMITQLDRLQGNQLALCVSHDWNIFPIKEFKLNQPLETSGDVGYLESVLFFKNNSQYHAMGTDMQPVRLASF